MAFGKKIRNRVLGLLVLLSIAMILVPAIMDPGQVYKKSEDAIAVNGKGALTDRNGRLVEGSQDYSDLLSPIEGADITPEQLAAQNAGTRDKLPDPIDQDPFVDSATLSIAQSNDNADPFASVNSNNTQASVTPVAPKPIPADGASQVQRLKQAQAQNNTPKSQNEVLKSSKNTLANTAKPSNASNNSSANNNTERLVSSHAKSQTSTASTASTSAAQAQGSGFAVQVGVFSSKQNADAIVAKLKAAGISARQVPAVINGRSLIRVYAGAPKSKDAANSIARRVQQVTGTKPSVVAL